MQWFFLSIIITEEERVPYIGLVINMEERIRSHSNPTPVSGSSLSAGFDWSLRIAKISSGRGSSLRASNDFIAPFARSILGQGVSRRRLLKPYRPGDSSRISPRLEK